MYVLCSRHSHNRHTFCCFVVCFAGLLDGTAAEHNKASFALAWVLDEDESEREKGVTMDVATKEVETVHHDFTLLDTPGHADFVPSLLTGTAAADVGLMVVPSDYQGHSVPEHVALAKGLGLTRIIVAINKLDTTGWQQARYLQIKAQLEPVLKRQGYGPQKTTYIPLSGLDGTNVWSKPPSGHPLRSWYKDGMCLQDAMNALPPAQRQYGEYICIFMYIHIVWEGTWSC